MKECEQGRRLALSLPRRLIADLMHASRQVPLVTAERRMGLQSVSLVRKRASPRVGWCAIFIKAYARVAQLLPELRRSYMSCPWPHLYEHPESVASVAVERRIAGELGVLFGRIRGPEQQSLLDIQRHLQGYKEKPIEEVSAYRQMLRISSLPWPFRRALWWYGLNISGWRRCKYFGTFGISVVANLGAGLNNLISPLATTLNYSPLNENGELEVRLNFDHRVIDGATAARALAELEEMIKGDIHRELGYLQQLAA
ncbi:MAG: hypothetical protein KatS3mg105_1423 [Gemmatales bacterium]|nr:MAG: hypothetical protein KatS3mg105_1423 [Gemmatales bacterium]